MTCLREKSNVNIHFVHYGAFGCACVTVSPQCACATAANGYVTYPSADATGSDKTALSKSHAIHRRITRQDGCYNRRTAARGKDGSGADAVAAKIRPIARQCAVLRRPASETAASGPAPASLRRWTRGVYANVRPYLCHGRWNIDRPAFPGSVRERERGTFGRRDKARCVGLCSL